MPGLLTDLRYALRYLRKEPFFTLAVTLMFVLGIGVNTAIFSLTYAIVLKRLPIPNPNQLIRYTFERGTLDISLSEPLYDAIRAHQSVSSGLLAWSKAEFLWDDHGTTRDLHGALMSGNGFAVLEIEPSVGRAFATADDTPGGGAGGYTALLSHEFWKTRFAADPSVIGKTLLLNQTPVTIIGVAPPGFASLEAGERADVILPLSFAPVLHPKIPTIRRNASYYWLSVFGRLRPGQSIASARANLAASRDVIYREADPTGHNLNGFFKSFVLTIEPGSGGRSLLRPLYAQPLLIVELLSALLLVLCCANIGLLVVARLGARRFEFAVRAALGAGTARLLGQTMLEIALLTLPGLAIGLLVASQLAGFLVSMLGQIGDPITLDIFHDPTVFLYGAAIAILTALVAGLWPALLLRSGAPMLQLKDTSYSVIRSSSKHSWTLSVQAAAGIALLVPALLLGATFAQLYLEPSGFQSRGLMFAEINLTSTSLTPEKAAAASEELLRSLERAPSIQRAAIMSLPPLRGWLSTRRVFSFGRRNEEHSDMDVWPESVTPAYFDMAGTRILAGRGFTAADDAEHVCILSRSAAAFFFPGDTALGRFVYIGQTENPKEPDTPDPKKAYRVIGIAEDAHFIDLRKQPDRIMYTPITREFFASDPFQIGVRSSAPAIAAADIRSLLHTLVPTAPPPTIYTYGQLLNDQLRRERMLITVSSSFGAVALALVGVGLFGLLMRSVAERTREIGIRVALGGAPGTIFRLVVLDALKHIAFGSAAGIAIAYGISHLIGALLFRISPVNPLAYLLAAAVLLAVAICAAAIPGRRALAISPIEALRSH